MKLTTDRPFANVGAAKDKLLELANAIEADAGQITTVLPARGDQSVLSIGPWAPCMTDVAGIPTAVKAAIADGFLTMHPSGGYVSFTQAGADLFA
jgi:hypothetical protein